MFSSLTNGFLPQYSPLLTLPSSYNDLEALLSNLPSLITQEGGLESSIQSLPLLALPSFDSPSTPARDALLHALFRDYAILSSAFLLEGKVKKGGVVRTTLPSQLAIPLFNLSTHLSLPPFLEYSAYCLSNSVPQSPSDKSFTWDTLCLVRSISGAPEEETFILIHAEIESHTPALLLSIDSILCSLSECNTPLLTKSLLSLHTIMSRILSSQLKMFNACNPSSYVSKVRPWIFGTKGNPDFPGGALHYQGVEVSPATESSHWFTPGFSTSTPGGITLCVRGETGAQSTIIPSLDALLGIQHEVGPLRSFLSELEFYRPPAHRDFLHSLRDRLWGSKWGSDMDEGVAKGVMGMGSDTLMEVEACVQAFNACVAQVWAFRDIHVAFAELYIGRFTGLTGATGGTPYKAYLGRHRDESAQEAAQIGGEHLRVRLSPDTPTGEHFKAAMDECLEGEDGMPGYLRMRHSEDIKLGGGETMPGLGKKAFPKDCVSK